jgi:hypothetical protein
MAATFALVGAGKAGMMGNVRARSGVSPHLLVPGMPAGRVVVAR